MNKQHAILNPGDTEMPSHEERFARDVFIGFNHTPKTLSSRYLYDAAGSAIYEEIMDLEEYYPLRSEYEILESHRRDIVRALGSDQYNIIELGAGNGMKTKLLLSEFLNQGHRCTYYPVDISHSALEGLIDTLAKEFPGMPAQGITAEYFDAIQWLSKHDTNQNLVLFLGSNIGNFLFEEAVGFLYSLWDVLHDGDMVLVGMDLRKDLPVMLDAYNDPKGVTARFNMNLLERMNRELGATFDTSKFFHYEPYDVFTGAMTSYLISMEEQDVHIEAIGRTFRFAQWEPILIEQSYKYTEDDIDNLAGLTGFHVVEKFYDSRHFFCDALWQVKKKQEALPVVEPY